MEILDEDGSVIECQTNSSSGVRQYREVRWVTEWEGTHNFERLQPSRLSAEVKLAANQPMPSSISLLRVSMYALYAEGVIEVDIPFEVSGDAIEAAPNLEILLLPDTPPRPGPIQYEPVGPGDSRADPRRPTAPISLYKYRTHVKSMAGKPVFGLWDRYPWNLGNGFTLGDYVVVGTQLVDSMKGIRYRFSDQGVISDPWGDHGAECWGKVEQTAYDFDTIRHIIAVRPYEVKVSFVLSDILVPSLDPAAQ